MWAEIAEVETLGFEEVREEIALDCAKLVCARLGGEEDELLNGKPDSSFKTPTASAHQLCQ